jgi:hypothetical protein
MAIQAAKTNGGSVMESFSNLLVRKLRLIGGAFNHRDSVCPASSRETKPRPAKAKAECPEGNDLRPVTIMLCFLRERDYVAEII